VCGACWVERSEPLAAIHAERSGDDAEQRRLAAAGRPDQHEQLAHARLEVDLLEHLGAGFSGAESLAHGVGFDCDIFHSSNLVFRYAPLIPPVAGSPNSFGITLPHSLKSGV